jgi:hypothetical protein
LGSIIFFGSKLSPFKKNILSHFITNSVTTPLWVKWEDETPTPKVGDLGSSRTPECLEFDSRGQNTSHWGVLGVIGKVLKHRYLKWSRMVIWTSAAQVMGKRRGESQIDNLTSDH